MSKPNRICFDRILPRDLYRGISIIRPRGLRAIIVKNSMWPKGSNLDIGFLNGTPDQKKLVEEVATKWTEHANLKFDFNMNPNSEIRVEFVEGDGSWSAVGTDALDTKFFPINKSTMNLGWLDEGVILHEFGHAIGLGHEHQNPEGGIQWNEPVVMDDLAGYPNFWSEEETYHNVIRKYSFDQIIGTDFDPDSIMLYFFPDEWTSNNKGTHQNNKLSELDVNFIGSSKIYPFEGMTQDDMLVVLEVNAQKATTARIGKPNEEDLFSFTAKTRDYYSIETRGPTDLVMRLFGPDNRKNLVAEDDDGGQDFNAKITRKLEKGDYFIQVRHYNRMNGTGEYDILVNRY